MTKKTCIFAKKIMRVFLKIMHFCWKILHFNWKILIHTEKSLIFDKKYFFFWKFMSLLKNHAFMLKIMIFYGKAHNFVEIRAILLRNHKFLPKKHAFMLENHSIWQKILLGRFQVPRKEIFFFMYAVSNSALTLLQLLCNSATLQLNS